MNVQVDPGLVGAVQLATASFPEKELDSNPQVLVHELNRAVALHTSSLITYLADASPWVGQHSDQAIDVIRQIAANQKAVAIELSDHVLDLGGCVEPGQFPIEYTGYHDLSLDYLLPLMVKELETGALDLREIADRVNSDARARGIVQRAIGAAHAHVDMLCELIDRARPD